MLVNYTNKSDLGVSIKMDNSVFEVITNTLPSFDAINLLDNWASKLSNIIELGLFSTCSDDKSLFSNANSKFCWDIFLFYYSTRENLAKISNTVLDKREVSAGDNFLILSVHFLLTFCKESISLTVLYDCISILEYGIQKSPGNAQYVLWLARLYANDKIGGI